MIDELRRKAVAENLPPVRAKSGSGLRREVSRARRGLELMTLVVLLVFVVAVRACPALQPVPDRSHPSSR